MLIGVDASRANNSNRSGVEWYSYHLIKEMIKLDQKDEFILYSNKKFLPDFKFKQDNVKETFLKWPIHRFWTKGRLTLEMILKKPDVLFVPAYVFPCLGGKKNVITWHDVGYERYPETYTKFELLSVKHGVKRSFKKADKIITISDFTKEEMVNIYKIDPQRIEVIHLGLNHDLWQVKSAEDVSVVKKRYHLDNPYFVYLGRLAIRKNIKGLIRAYNDFRNKNDKPYQLLLIGSSSAFKNEINQEIKNSPYSSEIKKLGWVPVADLPAILSGARSLVLPSFYEGFGLPAIEAMACGCPVISSTSGSLPEIVKKAGLLVNAHDIAGFTEAMLKVDSDSELRQSLINRGLERSKDFSWEKCAKETLEVLRRV